MRLDDFGAHLNLLPVHAQGLSLGVEGSFEVERIGRWAIIVQAFQSFGALGASGDVVVGNPPGDVGGPIAFDKPLVPFGQDLGVKAVVSEGVDRLDIFPNRKGAWWRN